tara:strand:+ start:6588 stop:6800 length:213 start_codon:yes stop_codon:yes gene_type:complete
METKTIALFNDNLGVHIEHQVSLEVLEYIEKLEAAEEELELEVELVKEAFVAAALELNTTLNITDPTHNN